MTLKEDRVNRKILGVFQKALLSSRNVATIRDGISEKSILTLLIWQRVIVIGKNDMG